MARWNCVSCGISFDGLTATCNICQAEERRERDQKRANRDQEQANREAEYQAKRLREQLAWEAEVRHREKIAVRKYEAERNKEASESYISNSDAREHGYDSVREMTAKNNPHNIKVSFDISGECKWNWSHAYKTDRLNNQFRSGISAGVESFLKPWDKNKSQVRATFMRLAKEYGYWAAETEIKSFTIRSSKFINDVELKSVEFTCDVNYKIDENTGELKIYRDNVITGDEQFDKLFLQGVDDYYTGVNTPEHKAERLANEVPKIQRQRQLAAEEEERRENEIKAQERKRQSKNGMMDLLTLLWILVALYVFFGPIHWMWTNAQGIDKFFALFGILVWAAISAAIAAVPITVLQGSKSE